MTLLTITARELQRAAEDDAKPPPAKQGPKKRRAPTLQVTGTTPEQQKRWQDAADRARLPLAAWIRRACDGPTAEELDRAASLLATFGAEQHRRGAEGKATTADVRARAMVERIARVLMGGG